MRPPASHCRTKARSNRWLEAAAAESLPLERKCFAARLAAELTTKFGVDPQAVRKAVWKLEQAARSPQIPVLARPVLLILDEGPTPATTGSPAGANSRSPSSFPNTDPGASSAVTTRYAGRSPSSGATTPVTAAAARNTRSAVTPMIRNCSAMPPRVCRRHPGPT